MLVLTSSAPTLTDRRSASAPSAALATRSSRPWPVAGPVVSALMAPCRILRPFWANRHGRWRDRALLASPGGDRTVECRDVSDDREGDVYSCPAGKTLTGKGALVNDGAPLFCRARQDDRGVCGLKVTGCADAPTRRPARPDPRSPRVPLPWPRGSSPARMVARPSAHAGRSRCWPRIANACRGSIDRDQGGRTAPATNPTSPPPPTPDLPK